MGFLPLFLILSDREVRKWSYRKQSFYKKNVLIFILIIRLSPKSSQLMILFRLFQLVVQNLGLFTSFIDFYLILTRKCGDTKSIFFSIFEKHFSRSEVPMKMPSASHFLDYFMALLKKLFVLKILRQKV